MASAAAEAISGLGAAQPGLIVGFASSELSGGMDLDRAAAELAESAPGTPAIGLTGRGLIGPSGRVDDGCAVVAFSDAIRAGAGRATGSSRNLRAAGVKAATDALEGLGEDSPDLMLIGLDSSVGDMAETLAGIYEVVGPRVPLAGGASGGATRRQFFEGEATEDSVVAVAIKAGDVGVGLAQSAMTRGEPSIVTRADGLHVFEIDGRPAAEVYLEGLGLAHVPVSEQEFEELALAHPIAQLELHEEADLRHVLARTDEGALVMGSRVPAQSAIEVIELIPEELPSTVHSSAEQAIAGLGADQPHAAIVFDCASRRRALRDSLDSEIDAVGKALGGAQLAGLYTNGEIARIRGVKGDRNHAVVTVAFG